MSKIWLKLGKALLVVSAFILAFALSGYILDLTNNFLKFISLLINGKPCSNYDCTILCCEDELVYVVYSLIFVSLLSFLYFTKRSLMFAITILFYIGLIFGTFLYKIAVSGI